MAPNSFRLKHLSQEHRAALRLAIAAREAAPEDESELPDFARKVCGIFMQEIEVHFREEEKHVLPRLAAAGRQDLVDRTLAEHARMRELVAAMAEPTVGLVREFGEMLQAHVEFEENEVWEVLEPHPVIRGEAA